MSEPADAPPPRDLARDLLALVKPGIVASNALTTMAGFAIAAAQAGALSRNGTGIAALLALFGSSCLVAGSCALNNWIDRDIDALMERTKRRPTAVGRFGRALTLSIAFALLGLGLALLALLGPAPVLIGAGGALVYVLPYSLWAKRRTTLSSFIGGIAGSVPPLIGWAAIDPRLGIRAWILFALLILWQQAHVRALSVRRADEYERAALPLAGLRSAGSSRLWVVLLLLFSPLLLPFGLPVVLTAAALALLWLLAGAGVFHRKGCPRSLMFASSLVYLVVLCLALLLSTLLSP